MATPYYLTPANSDQGDVLFQIPIYSNPNPQGPVQTAGMLQSVWESTAGTAADLVGDASNYVFDTAKNTWVAVKTEVSDTISDAVSGIEGVFDWAKYQVFLIVGGLLVVVWVVARSGILKQAAGVLR